MIGAGRIRRRSSVVTDPPIRRVRIRDVALLVFAIGMVVVAFVGTVWTFGSFLLWLIGSR